MQVRRGITRTVFLTRRYAIKLPSLRSYGDGLTGLLWSICRGILANQGEAEWWRNSGPEDRRHLCPVLRSWLGGAINIYPRCQPYLGVDGWNGDEHRWERPPELADAGFLPGDLKPANLGWLDGRVVVLDYDMNWNGCPHDRSGLRNRLAEKASA